MFGWGKATTTPDSTAAAKAVIRELAAELRHAADALDTCARALKNHYAPGTAYAASLAKQAGTKARRAVQGIE